MGRIRQTTFLIGLRDSFSTTAMCTGPFEEFPHPATGPRPRHLARLAAQLGTGALEASWQQATSRSLPQTVRDYLATHPPAPTGQPPGSTHD